jgi:mono/diheme cytochrome c family protein
MKMMNRPGQMKLWLLPGIGLAVIVAIIFAVCIPFVYAGPPTTPEKPVEKNTASGAALYAIHCNRCHAERYAPEFTAAHWKTIMIHMRVRANLPAAQAQEILKYLQEDSGQ